MLCYKLWPQLFWVVSHSDVISREYDYHYIRFIRMINKYWVAFYKNCMITVTHYSVGSSTLFILRCYLESMSWRGVVILIFNNIQSDWWLYDNPFRLITQNVIIKCFSDPNLITFSRI